MLGAVTGKQARELRPGGRWVRIFSAAVVAGFVEKGHWTPTCRGGASGSRGWPGEEARAGGTASAKALGHLLCLGTTTRPVWLAQGEQGRGSGGGKRSERDLMGGKVTWSPQAYLRTFISS